MIHDWEKDYPGRIDNMLTAMGNVLPSHLMDRNLYPFETVTPSGVADADGDKAFDDEDFAAAAPANVVTFKRAPPEDDA